MKKIILIVLISTFFIPFAYSGASAKAIGLKGGYTMPKDDLKSYDDTISFGLYFDMGTFLIKSLDFRPGIDYFKLKHDNGNDYDVYGIHFDWYWHFLGNDTVSPFLGFGPVLNYYSFEDDNTSDEDSDAGVDLFLGFDLKISNTPVSLMIEGRYKFLDIAARDQIATQVNLGLSYKF